MTIRIPAAFEGRLLRSYLQLTLGLSTTALSRLKKDERGILINGQHVTVRYVLHEGDLLELAVADTPETASATVLPARLPLDVLYEDDSLIALNKPAGMPTHPSHGHLCDTLANALAYRAQEAGEPFVFRPLGRLDADTSGVVLAARTQAASGFLGGCIARREVVKRYLALVEGGMEPGPWQVIDAPIARPDAGVVMRAVTAPDFPGAEAAVTRYRVLCTDGAHSLVLAQPVTGRTHQIRVHLSYLGHPLLSDRVYGRADSGAPFGIARHALHCLSLSVPMPYARASGGVSEVIRAPASGLCGLDPRTPLNMPSPDGCLHLWAPPAEDVREACRRMFGELTWFGSKADVGTLAALDLGEE